MMRNKKVYITLYSIFGLYTCGAYLKVLVVWGKFEGANLEIFVLVLFWIIEGACGCLTSRIKIDSTLHPY